MSANEDQRIFNNGTHITKRMPQKDLFGNIVMSTPKVVKTKAAAKSWTTAPKAKGLVKAKAKPANGSADLVEALDIMPLDDCAEIGKGGVGVGQEPAIGGPEASQQVSGSEKQDVTTEVVAEREAIKEDRAAAADDASAAEAAAAPHGDSRQLVLWSLPALPQNDPLCQKCGYSVDVFGKGVRLVSKTTPTWWCNKCNTKQAQLFNIFGQWPIEEFKELDEEEKRMLWRAPASDKHSLTKLVKDSIVKRLVESRSAAQAGTFLPLSVYAKQGFDTDAIQKKARKEEHPVLGTTYQVRLHSDSIEKKEERVREQLAEMINRRPLKKALAASSTSTPAAVQEGAPAHSAQETDDDSSSSFSSSSSSSTSPIVDGQKDKKKDKARRKKKAAKKLKKQKKKQDRKERKKAAKLAAAEKEEAKARKEADKVQKQRVTKLKSDANRVLAKVAGPLGQVESLARDANVEKLPSVMKVKLANAVDTLRTFYKDAKAVMDDPSPSCYEVITDSVAHAVKEANAARAAVQNMLAAIEKIAAST